MKKREKKRVHVRNVFARRYWRGKAFFAPRSLAKKEEGGGVAQRAMQEPNRGGGVSPREGGKKENLPSDFSEK